MAFPLDFIRRCVPLMKLASCSAALAPRLGCVRVWRAVPLLRLLALLGAVCISGLSAPLSGHGREPVVPGFARFHGAAELSASVARLLVTELNCVSCHRAAGLQAKPAPNLNGVMARVKADYVRKYLAAPHGQKPGTTMPSLMEGRPAKAVAEDVEALVHYLGSLGPRVPEQTFPIVGSRARGETIFHSVGCVACHNPRGEKAPQLSSSVPLEGVAAKYTLPTLQAFLRDPHTVRAGGRMPNLNLSLRDAGDLAAYLLELPEVAQIRYSYYEGNWDKLPDFSALTPKFTGSTAAIDTSVKQRRDRFGLRFEGYLNVLEGGAHEFFLGSDDGSRLLVDGKVVVANPGIHPYNVKRGKIDLPPGSHAITVEYFEQGGEERLTVEFTGPGRPRAPLAGSLVATQKPPQREELAWEVDSQLAARGRELFADRGCASCHQLNEGERQVASTLVAKPLAELPGKAAGCLAEQPPQGLPHYGLSASQRELLLANWKAIQQAAAGGAADEPGERIQHTMLTMNCYACHARGGIGGVEEPRNLLFKTTIQEMGDEGRIPPGLDLIGYKLTRQWLADVLEQGADDRPYMLTRMPKFGPHNVGHLGDLLPKVDRGQGAPAVDFQEPLAVVKEAGRKMVGDKGFSCIKCHTFGRFEATGIQSIDMRTMTRRLNKEWLVNYLANPQVFRPRTRMPSAWPTQGKSLLKDVLDGDVQKQIEAVWLYLSDGPRARIPSGLVSQSLELIPVDDAVIYRNFIQGAGPRAIGVGYPEGVHLAFDANQMRLALIWQGRFIDARRHWTGRGQGYEGPAGENVVAFPDAVSFAWLDDAEASWPKEQAKQMDYRFRGYRLRKDQRPTFLYRYGRVAVEDYFDTEVAGDAAAPMRRIVKLALEGNEAPPAGVLYMRVAAGSEIQAKTGGWYEVDGRYQTRVVAAQKPVLRRQNDQQELLLPVEFQDGKSEVRQEIQW